MLIHNRDGEVIIRLLAILQAARVSRRLGGILRLRGASLFQFAQLRCTWDSFAGGIGRQALVGLPWGVMWDAFVGEIGLLQHTCGSRSMGGIRDGSMALSCPRHATLCLRTWRFVCVHLASSTRMSSASLPLPSISRSFDV